MKDFAAVVEAAIDADKESRRGRFKDAISRTKSKWKKEKDTQSQPQEDFQLSDDVNDFLAAGRKAASTVTTRPVSDELAVQSPSPRPSTADSQNSGQRSPRGLPVPRLDVSQTRWPNARLVVPDSRDLRSRSEDHLTPNYNDRSHYERSQSFSSALKKRTKPRGLSVTFANAPPDIIGEGGDESEIPTCEISRFRQRSRSLSPYLERPSSNQSNDSGTHSPLRRKPVPPPSPPAPRLVNADQEDAIFQPKPMRRIQTGFNQQQTPFASRSFETQLQQALRLGDEDGENEENPVADPRIVPVHVSPARDSSKQSIRSFDQMQAVIARDQAVSPQYRDSPAPPIHHPNVQQSRETSYKSPPPKVPNFYAEINRQNSAQRFEHEKQPYTQQMREVAMRPQLQPSPDLYARPTEGLAYHMRQTRQVQEDSPGGWI